MSHPSWGAWIEIIKNALKLASEWLVCGSAGGLPLSHPSWGAWIEICLPLLEQRSHPCRTPHGVRGLKYLSKDNADPAEFVSHPSWGAWIEIFRHWPRRSQTASRTPHGVRGLK